MSNPWKGTKYPGVRFREHPDRKHGLGPDRYFAIRAQVGGKRREEGLGWASEGWSAQKAAAVLADLKKAHTTGEGAKTLQEKRGIADAEREAEQVELERLERENVTFTRIFYDYYLPAQRLNKSKSSCDKEEGFVRNWIGPAFGDKPLKAVVAFDLERLKKTMMDAGKSPKTIHYVLGATRQVFNFASRNALYAGDNPVRLVKKPVTDNRRIRFLTHEEAQRLLDAIAEHSQDVHDMALLSLHTGMRAGEIFSLTWGNVDLGREVLTLLDTKNGKTRSAFMTREVKDMIEARRHGDITANSLVFPSRKGCKIVEISNVFQKIADETGLNKGVTDRRLRVVFHTCRHSFASWLVEQGVDLYTVKELMGHKTLAMTERYSHLAPDHLRRAMKTLEAGMAKAKPGKVLDIATGRR